jgi:hypothetical protein
MQDWDYLFQEMAREIKMERGKDFQREAKTRSLSMRAKKHDRRNRCLANVLATFDCLKNSVVD